MCHIGQAVCAKSLQVIYCTYQLNDLLRLLERVLWATLVLYMIIPFLNVLFYRDMLSYLSNFCSSEVSY